MSFRRPTHEKYLLLRFHGFIQERKQKKEVGRGIERRQKKGKKAGQPQTKEKKKKKKNLVKKKKVLKQEIKGKEQKKKRERGKTNQSPKFQVEGNFAWGTAEEGNC